METGEDKIKGRHTGSRPSEPEPGRRRRGEKEGEEAGRMVSPKRTLQKLPGGLGPLSGNETLRSGSGPGANPTSSRIPTVLSAGAAEGGQIETQLPPGVFAAG